jgi:hypothetical protein
MSKFFCLRLRVRTGVNEAYADGRMGVSLVWKGGSFTG